VGHAALEALAGIEGLDDLEISLKPGYPEVIVDMDRDLMAVYDLSPGTVAARLRNEIQGELATRFSRGAEKVDIRVRADQTRLRSIADLGNLSVKEGPVPIPLRNVARLREEEGPGEIRRISQRRTVRVSGNVTGRNLGAVSADIERVLKTIPMPPEMHCLQSGQKRELNTAFESLRFALLMAAFLVFVVMACQFESVVQPALVMCTAPMAFIGVAYALHGTGTHLSVMVFLGGIVLMGIVVNDAIILVDYINQLRARGFAKKDAIVEAGKARLRPIIMTTATTVLGLLPMLIASGEGAEMRRPMALTLVSGLTSATFLTLLVIPTAYSLFSSRDKT
jgi:HAE1 family hydrophobic/amphiphilic exporter-1